MERLGILFLVIVVIVAIVVLVSPYVSKFSRFEDKVQLTCLNAGYPNYVVYRIDDELIGYCQRGDTTVIRVERVEGWEP